MKFESYLIVVVGMLVAGIICLIYLNPDDVVYYGSLQKIKFEKYGDYHFEPVDKSEKYWSTLTDIKLVDDDRVEIIFNGNDYSIRTNDGAVIYAVPKFEYAADIAKGQTFIATCHGESAPDFLNYMGVVRIEEKYYYQFYHNSGAVLPDGATCRFPEIIRSSLDANLDLSGNFAEIAEFWVSGIVYRSPDMIIEVPHPCDILKCENEN